jgi:hypothetical protein
MVLKSGLCAGEHWDLLVLARSGLWVVQADFYVWDAHVSEQHCVSEGAAANTNVKPLLTKLHQHRLLREVYREQGLINPHLAVKPRFTFYLYEFICVFPDTKQSHTFFF